MNAPETRNGAREVGGCLVLVVGLVASLAEILNFFGVKPSNIPLVARSDRPAPAPAPAPASASSPAPARPARLVLVVENAGDMAGVTRAATAIASRLSDDDIVSLIAFVGSRHVWILRDEPGGRGRDLVRERCRTLFAVSRPPLRPAAVADALHHLDSSPRPGPVPAVVVLSASVDDEAIDRWMVAIRSGSGRPPCVFSAAEAAR